MAETTNEAALRIARIIEQRMLMLAANFAGETTAAGEDLKGGWKPDLEPRWPKGTPGTTDTGHPLGGAWMRVVDILGTIDKSISSRKNLTWLAKGSTRIKSIQATREGGDLRLDITLKDGRSGQLKAVPDAPFEKLMARLVQIDSGQRVLDQPQGAKPHMREPGSPAPDLSRPGGARRRWTSATCRSR
jgi:hypothetical protein